MDDRSAIGIENVLVPPERVAQGVQSSYPLRRPLNCTFIERGFNDHYLIRADASRYVCRLYLNGKYYIRGADDFRFELELLDSLCGCGVSVAAPLRCTDGNLMGSIATSAGERALALFAFAEGREIKASALTSRHAYNLGLTVGALHRAMDAFWTPHGRYHLDLDHLIRKPLALIGAAGSGEQRARLRFLPGVDDLIVAIEALGRGTGTYGIIHGDLHLGNIHFADDRPTLFDFDHCAYGWRAYDLAVLRSDMAEDAWEALLRAYELVRPLSDVERSAIPAFVHARTIWDMGDELAMESVWAIGSEDSSGRV